MHSDFPNYHAASNPRARNLRRLADITRTGCLATNYDCKVRSICLSLLATMIGRFTSALVAKSAAKI